MTFLVSCLTDVITIRSSLEVALTSLATYSSCDREIVPMSFTFGLDLGSVTMNQLARCLGQRSQVIVWTRTQTVCMCPVRDTQTPDRLLYLSH